LFGLTAGKEDILQNRKMKQNSTKRGGSDENCSLNATYDTYQTELIKEDNKKATICVYSTSACVALFERECNYALRIVKLFV
jgi:hypothetical protein